MTENDLGKYKPTLCNDWPWVLLIVIAYDTISENCLQTSLKGQGDCNGVNDIQGM